MKCSGAVPPSERNRRKNENSKMGSRVQIGPHLDGLEEGNTAEDLKEGSPEEDLGHAAALDEHIVGGDGHNLTIK
jgi:hypothetical protein